MTAVLDQPDTGTDPVLTCAYRYAVQKEWAVLAVYGVNDDGTCECDDPHDGTRHPKYTPKDIGKHPVDGRSWADGTTDLEAIEQSFAPDTHHNIAIVPGLSKLLVLDVDSVIGEDELRRFHLPETLEVKSGKGRHLYFAADDVETIPSSKLGIDVDTRGATGYIVAPPSRHRSGATYEWVNWPTEPAQRPDDVVVALRARTAGAGDAAPIVAEPVSDEDLSIALKLLKDEEPEDEKRSDQHYAFVARAVEDGHPDGEILTLVRAHKPSTDKYGDRLEHETRRTIQKVRARGTVSDLFDNHNDNQDDDGDAASTINIAADGYRLTDTGNSERLIRNADGKLRFVHKWGKWIVFRNGKWDIDSSDAHITEAAKQVAKDLFRLRAGMEGDTTERQALVKWAQHSESAGAIAAMIKLARGNPGIITNHEDLDADPYLLNVANGTVDLRTGHLRQHDPDDLMTLQVQVAFDPTVTSDLWLACLNRWHPDEEMRDYVQFLAGACATGIATETLDVLYGTGQNGKSKYVGALQHVLGGYTVVPHKSLLVAGRNEQHETVKADLLRRRGAFASESSDADELDEEQVKSITGRDRMRTRRMREDAWEFDPTHTIVLASNYRPRIKGDDKAIWRRVRLIPWNVTIPDDEVDTQLETKLQAEASGILNWIIEGARRFIVDGFDAPEMVRVATAEYRRNEDLVGNFIAETLVFDRNDDIKSSELADLLEIWCKENGVKRDALTMRHVAPVLKRHGCNNDHRKHFGTVQSVVWEGCRQKRLNEPTPVDAV